MAILGVLQYKAGTGSTPTTLLRSLGGVGSEIGVDIDIAETSGNIYVCGRTPEAGDNDGLLVKYAPTGAVVWQKSLQGAGYNDYFNQCAVDSLENVLVVGESGTAGSGTYHATISKYDKDGILQFQKPYTVTGATFASFKAIDVDLTTNEFITAGQIYQGSGNVILVTKWNSLGNPVWTKRIDNDNTFGISPTAVKLDSSGNIYIVGSRHGGLGASNSLYVAKLSSSGTSLWQRTLGFDAYGDLGNDIAITPSGDVYVAGLTYAENNPDRDALIARFSSAGTLMWRKYFHANGVDSYLRGVDVDASGNAYVVGGTNNLNSIIAKITINGVLEWQRSLDGTVGSEVLGGIKVHDNYWYATGSQSTSSEGSNDVLLTKFPLDGTGTGNYGTLFSYQPSSLTYDNTSLTATTRWLTISNETLVQSGATLVDATLNLTETDLTTV
jgi:hypothetical protein